MAPAPSTAVLLNEAIQDQLIGAYAEMRAELLRFLTARLGNSAAAEDVYQELFLRLRAAQLPAEIRDARSFIYKAAYNLANEHSRANRRQQARDANWVDHTTRKVGADTVARESAADDALDAKQRLDTVAACIAELPPRCREVFTLCRLRGQSHREVATALGISTKAVEKHITTALKYLIAKLGRTFATG